jgi:hypothetical protein
MDTITLSEIQENPEKLGPLLKEGRTVRVLKDGRPYFDATAPNLPNWQEFNRKIDELWAGSTLEYTNEDICNLIRRSRGE